MKTSVYATLGYNHFFGYFYSWDPWDQIINHNMNILSMQLQGPTTFSKACSVRESHSFPIGSRRYTTKQQQVLRRRLRLHDHGWPNPDLSAYKGARTAAARQLLLPSTEQAGRRRADHHSRAVLPTKLPGPLRWRVHGRRYENHGPTFASLSGGLSCQVGAVTVPNQI